MRNKISLSQKLVLILIVLNMAFVIKDLIYGYIFNDILNIILLLVDLVLLISIFVLEKNNDNLINGLSYN